MGNVIEAVDYITRLPEGEVVTSVDLKNAGFVLNNAQIGYLEGMSCLKFVGNVPNDGRGIKRFKRDGEVVELMVGNPLCSNCVFTRSREGTRGAVARLACPRHETSGQA